MSNPNPQSLARIVTARINIASGHYQREHMNIAVGRLLSDLRGRMADDGRRNAEMERMHRELIENDSNGEA